MLKVQEIAKAMNVVPKLRLGNQLTGGGVEPTGPHRVKFVAEPTVVQGKDDKGNLRKELKFIVEEKEIQYRWNVPILNKEGQPNYLIERLMNVEVGQERVLEMLRVRGRNYIDVRAVDGAPTDPEDDLEIPIADEEELGRQPTEEDLQKAGI